MGRGLGDFFDFWGGWGEREGARRSEEKGGWESVHQEIKSEGRGDGMRQGIRSGGDGNACARGPKVKGRGGALQEIKGKGKNGRTWMNQR